MPEPIEPDWTAENFDVEAAKRLVTNLRGDKARLQESLATVTSERDTLKTERDAEKTRADEAQAKIDKAEREGTVKTALAEYEIEMSDEEISDLFDGLDPDAVKARVERIARLAGKTKKDPAGKGGDEPKGKDEAGQEPGEDEPQEPNAGPLVRKPRPALTPGNAGNGDDGEPDISAIADEIRKNRR